jgi:hypothetical protein
MEEGVQRTIGVSKQGPETLLADLAAIAGMLIGKRLISQTSMHWSRASW